MKSPALYLLEVLFCSGLLLVFYRLLLVRKVSYAVCRRYLVAAILLSVAIPALNIPLYPARTVVYEVPLINAAPSPEVVESIDMGLEQEIKTIAASVDWEHIVRITVLSLYMLTVAVLLGLFLMHTVRIRRLRRHSRLSTGAEYTIAENPHIKTPFSFLRTIFLGEGYRGSKRDIVVCHEASHVRHRHSLERIVVEIVRCVFWFNPFVWIAGRWLAEAQEWEADRDVLNAGYDLTEYRTIIFHQLFGYNPDIACGLNHSLTKNRFAMMTKHEKRKFTLVRLGAAIPIVAGMMLLCSFTTRTPQTPLAQSALPTGFSLDGLQPVAVHTIMTLYMVDDPNGDLQVEYLPVDPAKYRYVKGEGKIPAKVTDLLGKDITSWAHKHYSVKPENPMFLVHGKLMSRKEYRAMESHLHAKKAIDNSSFVVYSGSEIGRRLGDQTVDALIVLDTVNFSKGSSSAHENDQVIYFEEGERNVKVLHADRITYFPGGDKIALAGNVRVQMRDDSPKGMGGAFIDVDCDSMIMDKGAFRLFNFDATAPDIEVVFENTALIKISSDGMIYLNGETVTTDKLKSGLAAWRAGRDPGKINVRISAAKDVKMGVITDVKEILRETNVLRVSYSGTPEPEIARMLSPQPTQGSAVVVVREGETIKSRNLFHVNINSFGKILAGPSDAMKTMSPEELTSRINMFVHNPSGDPRMSEKQEKEFALPGGQQMQYSVSQGIVSLQVARDTPYGNYVEVQNRIAKAFHEIRSELAQRQFGTQYDYLSEAEQNIIKQAVPLKITEAEPKNIATR